MRLVDLSTSGKPSGADVPPIEVALNHPRGSAGVFTGDRGTSVAAMAQAFEAWIRRQPAALPASSRRAARAARPWWRRPCGRFPSACRRFIISTVASGNVQGYVGPSDIMMMYSVTDVQGLNSISRQVLANGAQAMAGMVKQRCRGAQSRRTPGAEEAAGGGLTMFGVTTPCVQQVTAQLKGDYDCLVFHATGVGGQSMEKLVESRPARPASSTSSTTEICDLMMGGVFPATEDRFGAIIRTRMPYVGSVGALDMVNFGAPETVPERYAGAHVLPAQSADDADAHHAEENERMGRWIGERLNRMEGARALPPARRRRLGARCAGPALP